MDDTLRDALFDALPPKLREIADVIGLTPALKLSEAWPGIRVFVPSTTSIEHPIALAIGITAAEKLSMRYGGETITVPKADLYRRRVRIAKVMAERAGKKSGREVALEYGLHENYVYELWARVESDRQADMFPEPAGESP